MKCKIAGVVLPTSYFSIGLVIYQDIEYNSHYYAVLNNDYSIKEFRKFTAENHLANIMDSCIYKIGSQGYHYCSINQKVYEGVFSTVKAKMVHELFDSQNQINYLEQFYLSIFLKFTSFIKNSYQIYESQKKHNTPLSVQFPLKDIDRLPAFLSLREVTINVNQQFQNYLEDLVRNNQRNEILGKVCLLDNILYFGNNFTHYDNIRCLENGNELENFIHLIEIVRNNDIFNRYLINEADSSSYDIGPDVVLSILSDKSTILRTLKSVLSPNDLETTEIGIDHILENL